jgi:hypothetical protein
MKTIMDILEEINQIGYEECNNVEETGISVQGLNKIEKLLEEWSHNIVDECAGSFECEMEKCEMGSWYNEMYDDKDGDPVHPVLNRQSILDVKNKL